jgi:hypothetical protein
MHPPLADQLPPDTRPDVLLRESLTMLRPLARALVANGVTYPVFAQALKLVFLEAARAELRAADKRITDSSLSLLSGVHRKDVRAFNDRDQSQPLRAISLAIEVSTRWSSDATFCDEAGNPRPLPVRSKSASDVSFESLTQAVSKDFHSRSVLEELLRLGVAQLQDDLVSLQTDEFVPRESFADAAYFLGANGHDHLAAAVNNLQAHGSGEDSPFLEHAVFADELSPESVHQLQLLARRLWVTAFKRFAQAAQDAVDRDGAGSTPDKSHRIRFGAYCYSAPTSPDTGVPPSQLESLDETNEPQ